LDKYPEPTPTFGCDCELIQAEALELTRGQDGSIDKARALFHFVRGGISYNLFVPKHMPEHFRASNTLARGKGYCVQKAVLLVTLARASGIPARLGCAKIRNHLVPPKVLGVLKSNILPWHGHVYHKPTPETLLATAVGGELNCPREHSRTTIRITSAAAMVVAA